MHKGINTTMDEGQSMRKSAIFKIRVTPQEPPGRAKSADETRRGV